MADRGSRSPRSSSGHARVLPPERLNAHHDSCSFENGKHPSLDAWLRDRALASEGLSARTYVICDAATPNRIVGFYAISMAMERRNTLPNAKLRRGLPEQVPLLLLGRLAVDRHFRGMGLGIDLLSDALQRCVAASQIAGVRGVVAHAIDDDAVRFYKRHGFLSSPLGERIMLLPIELAQALFED